MAAAFRPPMRAPISEIAMIVTYQGVFDSSDSSGLRNPTVTTSRKPVVRKYRLVVIHSAAALVALETDSPMMSCSGKTAAHSSYRESTTATIAPVNAAPRPTLRRIRAEPDSWTKFPVRTTAAVVARSSMIARNTTASPATTPSPTSRMISASTTGFPSPGAPMSAAMTTNDSAAIIVWLTPSAIVRLAIGSCTFVSNCQRVEPIEVAASIGPALRLRIACDVMRIAIGML